MDLLATLFVNHNTTKPQNLVFGYISQYNHNNVEVEKTRENKIRNSI